MIKDARIRCTPKTSTINITLVVKERRGEGRRKRRFG